METTGPSPIQTPAQSIRIVRFAAQERDQRVSM
jgi:hypothetical protein